MTDNPLQPNSAKDVNEASLGYMLRLAAPMMVTFMAFTVMQFVDRFMVSRLGTGALAAILPAGFLSFIPGSFALGVIICANTFISQSFGKGNKADCSNYCWQTIYMGLAYFALVIAIMWPSAPWLFKMMNQPAEITNMEVTYLRILLYAQPVIVLIWATSQFFIGIHRPIVTMYAGLAGQVVNVAANYVLIFGKFGFPRLEIAGAGWGTFIGLTVEAVVLVAIFLSYGINKHFKSRGTLRVDFAKMRDLLRIGFPSGIGFLVNMAFFGMILFGLVGSFGKEALAATSAVFACINLSAMPIIGMGHALTAAVGKSIGKDAKNMAIKQTRVCFRAALVYMLSMGICFFIFRKHLMVFWSSDDKVIELGVNILICAAVIQVFDAMSIIYRSALRGAGDTIWLAGISALGAIVILGGGGLFITKVFPGLNALGPWFACTGNIIAIGLTYRWRFKSNHWRKIDIFEKGLIVIPGESIIE